jgi:hypothetical protein
MRVPVGYLDLHAGGANALAQFGGEVPLNFFARDLAHAGQQRGDLQARAGFWHQRTSARYPVARIALAHVHFVELAVLGGARHGEFFAHRPEGEKTDTELALHTLQAAGLELAFDGIADISGHVAEVRRAVLVLGHSLAIVRHHQEVFAALLAARDGHVSGAGIDAVLDELRDGFQRVVL